MTLVLVCEPSALKHDCIGTFHSLSLTHRTSHEEDNVLLYIFCIPLEEPNITLET
jgi:hypothetical protein